MSKYNFINFEISNMTATISFNRPEVYNALNKEAKLEILKALEETEKIKNIGAIIITGEGKAFCTGQDLNDRSVKASEEAVDLGHTLETEWNPLVNFIKKSKKIVIGAINGVCAGAGLPLAMSCDLIVAKPGVKFISGFLNLDRLSGKVLWSTNILKSLKKRKRITNISGFILGSGKIYAATKNGYLIVSSATSGQVEEIKKIGDEISTSPIISNGSLYILTEKPKILGFN